MLHDHVLIRCISCRTATGANDSGASVTLATSVPITEHLLSRVVALMTGFAAACEGPGSLTDCEADQNCESRDLAGLSIFKKI